MEILESNNRYTDNLSFCGDVLFFLLMIQKKNLYFPSPAHMLIIHSWWTKMFFLKHFRLVKNFMEELAQCFILLVCCCFEKEWRTESEKDLLIADVSHSGH